ncbi:hypothetical protein Xcel_0861 [Xylanimonas cellulosilytica DSM 15894]|uniref:Uncharacterized protein n=1 Tax=Xylanimonas cellulosilytica (strain DSM 15894 / JCM 12276 / CECT 5975 / KCTC 9989 / LMG 20990 / NBRC 107835 / XIL07) TaxID=446471 RepID=D1BY50_XYLCX|nr:peptidase inhibitor family I36 protein [Xylanimonas cellulosilytica]ACZ29893.1 hypothetical protein Xcel_0861 [Xylanimonas cellulosilytica DSM 15894]
MKTRPMLVLLATAMLAVTVPAAANAQDAPDMQERIETVLADNPGGVQTGWNEVTWDDGAVILTIAPDSDIAPRTIGSCATGAFCAYSQAGYLGSKLTFTTCTANHSVSTLGAPVRSIANARNNNTVKALNGSTVVLTVPANTGKNTTASITKLSCS